MNTNSKYPEEIEAHKSTKPAGKKNNKTQKTNRYNHITNLNQQKQYKIPRKVGEERIKHTQKTSTGAQSEESKKEETR